MILNLGILVLLPLFFCVFVGIPLLVFPKLYQKVWGILRVRIFVCWKYYDPELEILDRTKLMLLAMIKGESKAVINPRYFRSIIKYMDN